MKILYIITTFGHGIGGHYYSLRTTVNALKDHEDCAILNIGKKNSPVIESTGVPVFYILYKRFNPLYILKKLGDLIRTEKPDVIHSFDMHSWFFAYIISSMHKIPHLHTKCGGNNPNGMFPKIKNLIVYSQENKLFFESEKKYWNCNIHLIPNRVINPVQNIEKINKIRKMVDTDSKIFLRITRISPFYNLSILQSVNLVKRLNSDMIKSRLVVVGNIADFGYYQKLKASLKDEVFFLTDDEFTRNASELIDAADVVIGTGRGFMEAAMRRKILLSPQKSSDYPLLVTKNVFRQVFNKNFSERVEVQLDDKEMNYANITKALTEKDYAEEVIGFIDDVAKQDFDIETKIQTYVDIYKNLIFTFQWNFLEGSVILFNMIYDNYFLRIQQKGNVD